MEARFVEADDVEHLRLAAHDARAAGAEIVVVSEGPLGDPFVLAAGLIPEAGGALIAVRTGMTAEGRHRHPGIVAREMTSLDLVSGGCSVLCVTPPFDERLFEALTMCRSLWRDGEVASGGLYFPVDGAVNRPRPSGPDSPRLALDLTGGVEPPTEALHLVDLVVYPADATGACRVEPVRPAPVRNSA